jgi:hypothetical protein
MRDDQAWLVHDQITKQDQIEIKGTRRTQEGPFAAALLFHRKQGVEHGAWKLRRLADDGRVEEHRLRTGDADRHSLVVAGNDQVVEEAAKSRNSEVEVSVPIADVGS